jgi:hypothetical protein
MPREKFIENQCAFTMKLDSALFLLTITRTKMLLSTFVQWTAFVDWIRILEVNSWRLC